MASQEVSELKLAEIIKNSDDQKIETLRRQAKLILIEKLEDLKQPPPIDQIERGVSDTVKGGVKIAGKQSKKLIGTSTEKMRPVIEVVEKKIASSDAATKARVLAGDAKDWGSKVIGDMGRKAKMTKDKLAGVEGTTVSEYNPETSQRKPQSRLASVVIAVCIERLMSNRIRHWTLEEDLVLQALRLAIPDLSGADITELSSYLRHSNEAQMRGVLATTKGKYHELIVAHAENTDGDEISARIFEDLNHPGSDIEFIVDGQVIEAVQLKAVVSESLILEHQSRYPDITILATEEAASRVEGVDSSGFSNAQLQADVEDRLRELEGDGILDNVGDAFVVSVLSLAAFNAKKIAKGDVTPHDLRTSANDIAAGLTTTVLLDMIF